MNKRPTIVTLLASLLALAAGPTLAFDQVKTTNKEKAMVRGQVTTMTPQVVEVRQPGDVMRQVPVNEIVTIFFEDEGPTMAAAREHMMAGDYGDALASLEKIAVADVKRKEIAQEIEYSKAYCAAQLALSGNGDIAEAGKQMAAFITTNPNNYHYLQSCEMLGNLLAAARLYAKAETYYAKLAEAPWPDYKMRAAVAMGRTLLAQGKTAEAAKAFDEVLGNDAGGDLAENQRMAAKLGKARCMAAGGKADAAVKIIEDIIAHADADNTELHASAYNALGSALRKANKPKEAILAYLHTDLLYSSASPDAHAEALANLEALFNETHKPDHARRVRQQLDERYKNSQWAAGVR